MSGLLGFETARSERSGGRPGLLRRLGGREKDRPWREVRAGGAEVETKDILPRCAGNGDGFSRGRAELRRSRG